MIKELTKLANHLDAKGLVREASYLDSIIEEAADIENKEEPLEEPAEEAKKAAPKYVAAFLSDVEARRLRDWWIENIGRLHDKTFIHHMTLRFGPKSDEEIEQFLIGQEVALKVTGYGSDRFGQAVSVAGADDKSINIINIGGKEFPHITMATSYDEESEKYIPAVYSNELLENNMINVNDGPILRARVGVFLKDDSIVYEW